MRIPEQNISIESILRKNEARESKYWLRLIGELQMLNSDKILPLLKEIDELVAILTSIVKNSKNKK